MREFSGRKHDAGDPRAPFQSKEGERCGGEYPHAAEFVVRLVEQLGNERAILAPPDPRAERGPENVVDRLREVICTSQRPTGVAIHADHCGGPEIAPPACTFV